MTGDAGAIPSTIAPEPLRRGNLFLVGLPGAGKSTLGRQLARRLHKRFVDTDAVLEDRLGVSIPTIFEIEGETSFRDREQRVLAEVAVAEGIVLSTGGGVVVRAHNRDLLQQNGTVMYLHATPRALLERVRHARHRPLLQTGDPLARLTELYAERDPLYRQIADYVVASDRGEVMRLARGFAG